MGSDNQCMFKNNNTATPEEVNDFREPVVYNLTENLYFQKLFLPTAKKKKHACEQLNNKMYCVHCVKYLRYIKMEFQCLSWQGFR